MTRLLVLLFLVFSTLEWHNRVVFSVNEQRIINGEDAPEGRWPFMAEVRISASNGYIHHCGGAILNDDTILTAGHCVQGKPSALHQVVIGHTKLTKDIDAKYLYQIKQYIPFPNFTMETKEGNDLGVMKLARKIDFSNDKKVGKICLPSPEDEPAGDDCFALGWGVTKEGHVSASLQQAKLPIMDEKVCNEVSSGYNSKTLYCAGFKDGSKGICSGDSGSPFVCPSKSDPEKYLQYGITSYGSENCSSLGFFIKPALFLDWIRSNAES